MSKAPWVCPQCGRSLTVRNQEHTCGLFDFEAHFEGKDPIGRIAFDWICMVLDGRGPYEVLPMKTTIAFANVVNVAFVTTKRQGVELSFVLSAGGSYPRLPKSDPYSKTKSIYRARITKSAELDEELTDLLTQAYALSSSEG